MALERMPQSIPDFGGIGGRWLPQPPTPLDNQGGEQQQQPWDRTKFRDAWMSSGVRNVNDMNSWLQKSGWGNQVNVGGSKGDKMYLPGGDVIDAVYAAGAGGNKAGPMWTGAGNWMQGGNQQMPGGK